MKGLNDLSPILRAPPIASNGTVPVLVLMIGRGVLHHGRVGVIRSLGRMGVPVFAVVEDRFTPAAVSRYLAGAFIWDTHRLNAQRFLEGMATIGRQLKQPTIVIPTSDLAAILVARHADALRPWFILPSQPETLPGTLANKAELYALCQRIGVPYPDTAFPTSIDDMREFIEKTGFPVVVKAAEPWLLPEGQRSTVIARTLAQACEIYRSAERDGRTTLIFQEYIDPSVGEDWFFHGYRNAQSGSCVGFTGRKLRSYPPGVGPTTLGKAVVNDRLRQQTEVLLQAISYSGIMDLDFRFDKRDGQYKLLDFNPRIGAQFRLFEDHGGVDVARALYLDLTGARLPDSLPVDGRTFITEFHDLAASLHYFQQRTLTLHEWRRSLMGKRELAWFCRDDPLPFLMMCIRLLLRVGKRNLQIVRLKTPAESLATRG